MTNNRWQSKPTAALLAALALAGIVHQQAWAQGELLWSHQSSQAGENWNAHVVSLGDYGSQVLTTFGPYTDYTRLFSAYDDTTPTPVLEDISSEATRRHRVASAKEADVHVALYDVDSGSPFNTRNVLVRKYSSSSTTADWTYTFPEITNGHEGTNVHVTNDGRRVVALMHNIYQNETDIAVFDDDSGVPTTFNSVYLTTAMRVSMLSEDGSTLYLRSNSKVVLVDVNTGLPLHEEFIFGGTPYSDAISGDGSIFAYSTYNEVKIYREEAGVFGVPEFISLPGENYCSKLAISGDNSKIAMGFNYYDEWLRARVQVRDLSTSAVLLDKDLIGAGTLQNLVSALCLSSDGGRVAVGLWGDEAGQVPEVNVFNTLTGALIASFDTLGSVNAMDISLDGSRLAVASKRVHANTVASGGQIELFSLGSRDFVMSGVPRIGATVQFTFKARTGKLASLFIAPELDPNPIEVEDLGTLLLASDLISIHPMGVVPADDVITVDYTIPNDPSLIGTTLHFQGFASAPRKLSKAWVAMTILP